MELNKHFGIKIKKRNTANLNKTNKKNALIYSPLFRDIFDYRRFLIIGFLEQYYTRPATFSDFA